MRAGITRESLFKVLGPDGEPCHGGKGRWTIGEWREVEGPLVPCRNGLHLCTLDQLLHWLGPRIHLAEYSGERVDGGGKIVVRSARIGPALATWNDRTARLLAADCAERVLHLFERERPGDDRPRKAIEAARAFARGEITAAERDAAWDAASAAKVAAAWAAMGAAASAAEAAAEAAAWAAASTAKAAAWDAASTAKATAWAAVGAAASAAEAERAAARSAEHRAQTDLLYAYLTGNRT